MSGAVYTVELDGKIIARRESLLWVRLDAPDLYVVCTEAEGEGVCVKLAVDFKTEDGKTETRLEDFVYKFGENKLYGVEPTGEIEQVSGALKLATAEAALAARVKAGESTAEEYKAITGEAYSA